MGKACILTVTQIWFPEVYPVLEVGGRLVRVIPPGRERNYFSDMFRGASLC